MAGKRLVVPEADKILEKQYPVLDKGFVRLIDYLGGDSRIVQAARVSYGKETKTVQEDRGLIRYLMRHKHTSPFEQVVLTFHTKMPIFVARQWVRHRTARLNEISGRYSIMENEFYIPDEKHINPQSKDNKQGRSDETFSSEQTEQMLKTIMDEQKLSYMNYENRIEKGLAKELARINLPLSLYTQWYWQMDLHNLFHFLKLRLDKHAQYEIREYAKVIKNITKKVAPIACESFEDYILNAYSFSREESLVLHDLISGKEMNKVIKNITTKSEQKEFLEKYNKIINLR